MSSGLKSSEWLRGDWEAAQYGGERIFCCAKLEFVSMTPDLNPPLCFRIRLLVTDSGQFLHVAVKCAALIS